MEVTTICRFRKLTYQEAKIIFQSWSFKFYSAI